MTLTLKAVEREARWQRMRFTAVAMSDEAECSLRPRGKFNRLSRNPDRVVPHSTSQSEFKKGGHRFWTLSNMAGYKRGF